MLKYSPEKNIYINKISKDACTCATCDLRKGVCTLFHFRKEMNDEKVKSKIKVTLEVTLKFIFSPARHF